MKKWILGFLLLTSAHTYGQNLPPVIKLQMPARVWMEKYYLPTLAGRVLFVGVGDYTAHYHTLVKNPQFFETIDHDITKAAWGSPYGHHVMDIMNFKSDYQYDHLSMFGIFGLPANTGTSIYSVLTNQDLWKTLNLAHSLVKVGGTLKLAAGVFDMTPEKAQKWFDLFAQFSSGKYEVLFLGIGPAKDDAAIWWGRKISD